MQRNTGQEPSKNGRGKLDHLHTNHSSPLLPIIHKFFTFSTVLPLLPEATFTQSIQPNLGLSHICISLTSTINTVLAIQYSYFLHVHKHSKYSLIHSTSLLPFYSQSSMQHLLGSFTPLSFYAPLIYYYFVKNI